ncbi:MAG: YihY/virulence factor BrkB family protein [Deltaproteobacteria bacterium]|nr:YihY/virulence factor BrkB family protein [Deltaproteobacteria bacterium]
MSGVRRVMFFLRALVGRFYADHCLMRASALAYASLLSIVPLLAVMFSVLKGLGVQRRLEPILLANLSLSPETTHAIIEYIDRTNVGTLGTLGAATLIFSAVSVLSSIESSFNVIWRVSRARSIWRKVTDYVSVVMLTPFLMLAAVAITSSLRAQHVFELATRTQIVGSAVMHGLQVAPPLINAIAIGILYAVMPNRRPSFVPLAVSAAVAGVAWYIVQWLYVSLQIGAARYNAIYGALSQLPVTLVWLYVSWVIVLGGAELGAILEFGPEHAGASRWNTAALALHILIRAAELFSGAATPLNTRNLARELGVGIDAVKDSIAELERRGWLVAVDADDARYVLGRDPAQIELAGLAEITQLGKLPRGCDQRVAGVLQEVARSEQQAWQKWRLVDLIGGAVPKQGSRSGAS